MRLNLGSNLLWLSLLRAPALVHEHVCGLAGITRGRRDDRALADQEFSAHFYRSPNVILANKRFRLSWF